MEATFKKQEDSKLTDSLIYNIIKKIELKLAMEEKYEEARIPIIKQIPQSFGRYLYTPYCIGYFSAAMAVLMYLRFKRTRFITQTNSP